MPPGPAASIPTGLAKTRIAPAVARFLEVSTATPDGFPPSFALRGPRRVLDQGEVPCCVSCAIAAAGESANPGWAALAPLFHYFVTRTEVMRVSSSQAVDLELIDAAASMERFGICLDNLHHPPMNLDGMAVEPVPAARADASRRSLPPLSVFPPVSRIELLSDQCRELEWKRALLTGKPIVAGIDLPANYSRSMSRASAQSGRLGPSHAVLIIGYRDSERAFIVHDSRGPRWFLGGQWWMPYSFAESGFVFQAYSFRFR